MAPQVAPSGKTGQHVLDLGEHFAIVGIGPQETEDLVEPQNVLGPGEWPVGEHPQQGQFARAGSVVVFGLPAVQLPEDDRSSFCHADSLSK